MPDMELNLRFFDGEGGADAAAASAATTEGAQAPESAKPALPTRASKNPLAGVQYGKQAQEAEEPAAATTEQAQEPETTKPDKKALFEQLIKGEYRDEFARRVQESLAPRFEAAEQAKASLKAVEPILSALASKYGVKPDDIEGLSRAIERDDSYYEEEAERKGLTVEQYRLYQKMERENETLRRAVEERQRQDKSAQIQQQWLREGEDCKRVYPGFDLTGELSGETGERFAALLRTGVDVKTAYEVIHKDELLSGALQYAVQATQQKTMNNIRARGMRPMENGANAGTAAKVIKSDPKTFTRSDREEIARRAIRGERIEL